MRNRIRVHRVVLAAAVLIQPAIADAQDVDFNADILPVLAQKCFQCHGPDAAARKADLRLDLESAAKAEVVVPGDIDASEIIRRISSTDDAERMPPPESQREALTPQEVAAFRTWIAEGARWSEHWAFVTPEQPSPPDVQADQWPRNAIDRFVLARLEREGLQPSDEASRETLIRRLTLDLTGLPPTLDEVERFVLDNSETAYEDAVDRLLASPHYGEQMATPWLDAARYADTNGYQNDFGREMWPWRDWVIEAYNNNLPFDQFLVQQLAGDLLPNATQPQIIATGFNRNNRANTEGGSIEDEWRVENIVDRVDTTAVTFLGLSMGCARCHDHKFEPISQREFYQFFSFFNHTVDRGFYEETRGNTGPVVSLPTAENDRKTAELDEKIAKAQRELQETIDRQPEAREEWIDELRSAIAGPGEQPTLDLTFDPDAPGHVLTGDPEGHLTLGQAAAFAHDAPFSVALWAKPEGEGALFSKMDESFRGVDLLVGNNRNLVVHLIHQWDTSAIKVTTDRRIKRGTWSHIAVTWDGSGKAAGVRVYVNGEPAKLTIDNDSLSGEIATSEPLRIGSRAASERLAGSVLSFKVYESVPDRSAIRSLFMTSARALFIGDDGLMHEAAFDDFFDLKYNYLITAGKQAVQRAENRKREYVRDNVPTVMVMEEREERRPTYLLRRGAYDAADESEDLQPAVPAFLTPMPEGAPDNRLGLARWMTDPAHPLTARVAVNRIWHQLFGLGIVKTLEDFGVQSSPPSHPLLLDWLATHFVASGWDVKALQKLIVTSATYRQSSDVTPELYERDPENVLLARGARFRMPAEMVRDHALAVSGLLTPEVGGPPVKPYQPEGLWDELAGGASIGPYVQSEGDDLYRRSLYIFRKRTVPPPMLTTFDSPGWDICRVRRATTNTPLQSLALLNDEAYVEAARHLAQRMISEADSDARTGYGFRLVTGREPTATEQQALDKGLGRYRETYSADEDAAVQLLSIGDSARDESIDPSEFAAFTALAGVIINLDEAVTRE